ncbi:HlyD family type I secretion periplasmic adaptor subunit [Vacuolonema iberomarrocanum]|uniref:HlyD family type I secretion periplasmic adaptor subunit n=1 Tax=Vacuolonema iberomarrocanum TaxID=3454632 RepID=UPI0019E4AD6C|nr:HlyD family type I secretion periplasmic adaptor subunit [filamentous cyanobacterium LEGE 07170]
MKQLTTKNGHNNNVPNGSNGAPSPDDPVLSAGTQTAADEKALQPKQRHQQYDQAVILQQTSRWSRGIVWTIVGVTVFTVGWAAIGRIEQAVPAQGQLEPQGAVQNVQAPVGGVVEEILVEEGEAVTDGQVLIRFDPTAAQAQKESLEQIRDSLIQENAFYRSQMQGADSPDSAPPANASPQILALTTNRAALVEENRLFRAQLGIAPGENLTAEQAARLRAGQAEANTRAAAAQLEVAQLQQQLAQAEGQLDVAEETLNIDNRILSDIEPLVEEGALARIQFLRQQQESMRGESEVTRLRQEVSRLQLAIAQAEERLSNTLALTSTDILTRIADNEKRMAEIDSEINRAIVENEKQIAEINSQLSQANLNLIYQELRAPIDGMVFDIQPSGPGFVANTSEPILKVVPSDALVAEVYVTNQDIGFIEEGMQVDVRIDSFPFSEFGDIEGVVTHIGDDALPPDELYQFYRFPAKVELEEQMIEVNGREVPLQSGMSVSANIITRDRSILSIFTGRFTRGFDNFRNVR